MLHTYPMCQRGSPVPAAHILRAMATGSLTACFLHLLALFAAQQCTFPGWAITWMCSFGLRPQLGHASVLISSPAHSLATPIVRTRPLHSAPPPSQATPPNPQPRPLRAEHALPLVQSSWLRPLPQTTPPFTTHTPTRLVAASWLRPFSQTTPPSTLPRPPWADPTFPLVAASWLRPLPLKPHPSPSPAHTPTHSFNL